MPLFSGAKNGNLTNIRIELMTWLKAVQQFCVTDKWFDDNEYREGSYNDVAFTCN